MAYVFVSWLHPFKEHRFVVLGEDQMAVFDDTADWNRKLVVYTHKLDWAEGRIPLTRRAEGEAIPGEQEEPLRAECLHFLARMRDRQPPLTGIDSALQVLRVLEAGETSMQQGDGPVVTPGCWSPIPIVSQSMPGCYGRTDGAANTSRRWLATTADSTRSRRQYFG